MEYGLIGGRLGHSYSKPIHEALAGYDYRLCPLPTPEEAHAFMRARDFKAINVTIPYKELVMPYCDVIDDAARAIGSVNTIVNKNGRLEGHNTDFAGFTCLLRRNGISLRGKTVMLLGTGGTQKTVLAVARAEGAAQAVLRQPPQSRERHHLRGGRAARGRAGDRKHQPRGHVSEQRRMPCGAGELPTAGSCAGRYLTIRSAPLFCSRPKPAACPPSTAC